MGSRGKIGIEPRLKLARQRGAVSPISGSHEPDGVKLKATGLSDEAREEFDRVVSLLRERGVLDQLDSAAIADYAVCFDRLLECEREISARGILVEGRGGGTVRNPAITVAKAYRQSLVKYASEFGLTVGARSRLSMPAPDNRKQNPFEKFGFVRVKK
jgi:P27 family predicted phage terminase small subunit